MARPRSPASDGTLPPPLPPAERTVGQLIAEAIRLYGRRFWISLPLGLAPATVGVALTRLPGWWDTLFVVTAGAALLSAAYIGATAIASGRRPEARPAAVAVLAGVLVFAPFPFLASVFVLPGLAWLALVGLAVPAAVLERRGLVASVRRGVELARADYVHALGSLSALVLAAFLTATVLFFLLRGQGESTLAAAAFLALLVITPIVFLGAALLY